MYGYSVRARASVCVPGMYVCARARVCECEGEDGASWRTGQDDESAFVSFFAYFGVS